MASVVMEPCTSQNGCLETPKQWNDLGFDEPKSFYLCWGWHYHLMNCTIFRQENPQMQRFGTQWSLWCPQAWNIYIVIMNQVAFQTSELLQLSHPPCDVTQWKWLMGWMAKGLLSPSGGVQFYQTLFLRKKSQVHVYAAGKYGILSSTKRLFER